MFLDLLTGHHVGVDLKGDVVDLLAELVVELVGRVAVPPTHPLQIGRLLGKVCRQVLLHALDKLLQLFLFLGQVFISLGDGSRELSSACVGGVAHLSHLLVLRYRRLHYHLNCLHEAYGYVVPCVRFQTLQRVCDLVGVQWPARIRQGTTD